MWKVRDGFSDSDPLIYGGLCGEREPWVFHSSGPSLSLHFHTDASVQRPGFTLAYAPKPRPFLPSLSGRRMPQSPSPVSCGGMLVASREEQEAGGFRGEVEAYARCQWVIEASNPDDRQTYPYLNRKCKGRANKFAGLR